jgi:hypothetical protein
LLGVALALALIGHDRVAGATALLFTASAFAAPARYDLTTRDRAALLVPVIAGALSAAYFGTLTAQDQGGPGVLSGRRHGLERPLGYSPIVHRLSLRARRRPSAGARRAGTLLGPQG